LEGCIDGIMLGSPDGVCEGLPSLDIILGSALIDGIVDILGLAEVLGCALIEGADDMLGAALTEG